MVAIGLQSRPWQHSKGYQVTCWPSGPTWVWACAGKASITKIVTAVNKTAR